MRTRCKCADAAVHPIVHRRDHTGERSAEITVIPLCLSLPYPPIEWTLGHLFDSSEYVYIYTRSTCYPLPVISSCWSPLSVPTKHSREVVEEEDLERTNLDTHVSWKRATFRAREREREGFHLQKQISAARLGGFIGSGNRSARERARTKFVKGLSLRPSALAGAARTESFLKNETLTPGRRRV